MKCPCNRVALYSECCKPLHKGEHQAETALQLMKSRYSAFVKKEWDYLDKTTTQALLKDIDYRQDTTTEWTGLRILFSEEHEGYAIVEFIAYSFEDGEQHRHHERSDFQRVLGNWKYASGEILASGFYTIDGVDRNDACPCGSNLKAKKCCF